MRKARNKANTGNLDTSLSEAILCARSGSEASQLPQTVYRNADSGGWWHTNAFARILAGAELSVTILPPRYFA